ncbi:MAG: adenosylhomocysteinase [Candidatus Thermoplasmatota archaeon]|nr:adenosylhomocysteinase [Candidatus Thermoplasmatota archaeon]
MTYWEFNDLPEGDYNDLLRRGKDRLQWARTHMPVLNVLGKEISDRGALSTMKISMALHTEAKTGILAQTLARCGAEVRLASCNPLSTDDPVALALQHEDVSPGKLEVRARYGGSNERYYEALNWALDIGPHIVIDDGGDLVKLLHTDRKELIENVLGGCEETTTGIIRLRALQNEGKLRFPVMDVNDCDMKHLFDNRYGTGQSTIDGVLNATNLTIAGMRVVVAGYGWCGKGVAMRLKGMGANVTVSEVDPVKGVEAAMDGFRVLPLEKAANEANMVITVTGCRNVVSADIIDLLPDGCVLANSGHFDNEIDVAHLRSFPSFRAREHVTGYRMGDRTLYLLSEGRLVNLASGQGHPVEIMDMSFAIQAAGAEYISANGKGLPPEVIPFPPELDKKIARLKLFNMGYSVSELSEEQRIYLSSWQEGT